MGKTEDKDMIRNLNDEEVEEVSGGADEELKAKASKRPIITAYGVEVPKMVVTDYGGVRPHMIDDCPVTLGKYGMPSPKTLSKLDEKDEKSEK